MYPLRLRQSLIAVSTTGTLECVDESCGNDPWAKSPCLEKECQRVGDKLVSATHWPDAAIRHPFVAHLAEGRTRSGTGANCRHDSAAFFHITASFFIPSSSHRSAILRRSSTSVGRSMADWFSSDNSVICSIVLTARWASMSASAVSPSNRNACANWCLQLYSACGFLYGTCNSGTMILRHQMWPRDAGETSPCNRMLRGHLFTPLFSHPRSQS